MIRSVGVMSRRLPMMYACIRGSKFDLGSGFTFLIPGLLVPSTGGDGAAT